MKLIDNDSLIMAAICVIMLIVYAATDYFMAGAVLGIALATTHQYFILGRQDSHLKALKDVIAVHQKVLKMQTDLNTKFENSIIALMKEVHPLVVAGQVDDNDVEGKLSGWLLSVYESHYGEVSVKWQATQIKQSMLKEYADKLGLSEVFNNLGSRRFDDLHSTEHHMSYKETALLCALRVYAGINNA